MLTSILYFSRGSGHTCADYSDWQIYYRMYDTNIATIEAQKDFMNTPTMVFQVTTPNEGALMIKSAIDYLGAALLLTLLCPFLSL